MDDFIQFLDLLAEELRAAGERGELYFQLQPGFTPP
jgi:hypothetical protein